MRDPQAIDWGEWVTVIFASILASVLAGIGSAMAWFRAEKRALRGEMHGLTERMHEYDERHAAHESELAVIQTCQENTADRLKEIVKALDRIHDKLDVIQSKH